MEMFTSNTAPSKVRKRVVLQEDELVLALKNQESLGMKALVDMYSNTLFNVISRIVPRPDIAEDIVQETFMKIWYSANRYDSSKGRLFTWMINIARNHAIDVLRSKKFRDSKKNMNIDDFQPDVNCAKNIVYNIDTILVRELVHQLKPDLNVLLEMVYFKGYTHLEIADELKLPLGTVKTRIRTAISELRSHFD